MTKTFTDKFVGFVSADLPGLNQYKPDIMKPTVLAVIFMVVLGHQVSADERLGEASCDFAQRLHQKLSDTRKEESTLFSPLSIHSALSMLSLGARNETLDEMYRALNLTSISWSDAHEAYRQILSELSSIQSVDLEVVNAMLVNSESPIEQQFKNEAESKYLAKIETFKPREQEPEKKINDYVSQKTSDDIKEIIKKGSVTEKTSIVLVSTLAFNASWENKFDSTKTLKREFTCENGKKAEVEMMNDTRTVLYKKDNDTGVEVISMFFEGKRHSLVIALPRVGELVALEERLSEPSKARELLKGLQPTPLELSIPKFKIEKRVELKRSLREMGMEKAFEANSADFSGISQSKRLHISEVVHAAVFEIEERGTRGSSASVSAVQEKPKQSIWEYTEKFIADHSFMFWVQDSSNGQLVFQGSYYGQNK